MLRRPQQTWCYTPTNKGSSPNTNGLAIDFLNLTTLNYTFLGVKLNHLTYGKLTTKLLLNNTTACIDFFNHCVECIVVSATDGAKSCLLYTSDAADD